MEGFRYYGTGRYFAVTNRFDHKGEAIDSDRSDQSFKNPGDYIEPLQDRLSESSYDGRKEPNQTYQKASTDKQDWKERKDPYEEDDEKQFTSRDAVNGGSTGRPLSDKRALQSDLNSNYEKPRKTWEGTKEKWMPEGNYSLKDDVVDNLENRPLPTGKKLYREPVGSGQESNSKKTEPAKEYHYNEKPQHSSHKARQDYNENAPKMYTEPYRPDDLENVYPRAEDYAKEKYRAQVEDSSRRYIKPLPDNRFLDKKTYYQSEEKNIDKGYNDDFVDDDFYTSVDGPVLLVDTDQKRPDPYKDFNYEERQPKDIYKDQSLANYEKPRHATEGRGTDQFTEEKQNANMETEAYQKYNKDERYKEFQQPEEKGETKENLAGVNTKLVEPEVKEPVDEEVFCEEINEVKSEFLRLDELEKSDQESNIENDWPPPPPDEIPEVPLRNGVGKRAPEFHDDKTDLSLYTSFLTIDVNSSRKGDWDSSSLEDSKHRASLLNLVTGSHELDNVDDVGHIDKEDMDKIKHDLEMISKYLHNMPLGASFWPQNYDVLRDLVKLYLAAKNTNKAALTYLLDYFLKLDWPEIFLKCARKILKSYPQVFFHSSDELIPFEDPTPETLDMTFVSLEYAVAVIFQVLLSLAAEFTEVHEKSRMIGHKGFVQFIFQELLPKLHSIPWGKSTAREEFLHSANDILYNFVQSAANMACFHQCKAVETLINLRKETDYIGGNRVNIGCLLTLSFLIDDRNNQLILSDPAQVGLLVHYVEESLSKIDHCYADFSLSELIDGLTRIASHDQNKFVICSKGGISAITKVLKNTRDNDEKIAVCNLLWSLCFLEKCKQKIIGRSPEIFGIVQDLQDSENDTLRQLAEALVWGFEDKYTDQNPPPEQDVQHIFISYHPEHRVTMRKIKLQLEEKGYKVWMAKESNQSYPEHLIEAVENSAVVLLGVSRKYKQTPSIFAEADYSFHMCKPMIPIILERNYKPDGWLGMLVGSKVWLDFSSESKFQGNMHLLMRQIGERGKSERTVNILYIPRQQSKGDRNDSTEGRLIDISRWGNEEVQEWLQRHNLKNCVADDKLNKLSGSHLLRLHHLRRESPEFYYNSLEPQLGFTDVIDMMEFTQALESLTDFL